MSDPTHQSLSVNDWLQDELEQQYRHDPKTVDESWKSVFQNGHGAKTNGNGAAGNGAAAAEVNPPAPAATAAVSAPAPVAPPAPALPAGPAEQLQPLRGAASKIAQNMTASLSVPTATSQRQIAVKVLEENRQLINQYRSLQGRGKVSFTHLIGYAIVKALGAVPGINDAFTQTNGEPFRMVRPQINLGIAIDVAGKDGNRSLVVPSIKNAGNLNFAEYLAAFDDLVAKGRTGKLGLAELQGGTISLTNPGTVGTLGSVPRLMPGQGAIVATGAIDYPAEFQGVAPDVRSALGISKVMMVTCTYDHRIIQGAESGTFLGRIEALLQGEDDFYVRLFHDLQIPFSPARMEAEKSSGPLAAFAPADASKPIAVGQLIEAYRTHGHTMASIDPLGDVPHGHPELDLSRYGLTLWDMDREFPTGTLAVTDKKGRPKTTASLREIVEALRTAYCGHVGVEYMQLQEPAERAWLQARLEPASAQQWTDASARVRALEKLVEAEEFEQFLQTRFIGQKRFSLEGSEATIAALDTVLNRAAELNAHESVIGMAHRGRLNVLANVVGKPAAQIFREFEGSVLDSFEGSGDVKYHLGATGVRPTASGKDITVSVAFNPSHLEAVDPVVQGIVRPKQDRLGDTERARVIPILVHGDAAFAAQGVVLETINLSQLEGYRTGGTFHFVINNQIGFTTLPSDARSGPYATDVAHAVNAPVFHVNGDDPDAVCRIAQLAFEFRQHFKKDVVVDMLCYRRHGHNEGDDPSYTQPVLYRKIRQQSSVVLLYGKRLVRDKVLSQEEVEAIRQRVRARLSEAFEASKQDGERFESSELRAVSEAPPSITRTAVEESAVARVLEGMSEFPEGFTVHPKLRSIVEKRKEILHGAPMDWATAEAVAFGTLLLEGTPVRLSGQDVGRGTFSQRHLEFHDNETSQRYVPLQALAENQAPFQIYNSSLSEYGVMGFEFGYSVADPLTLVLWEAQFGDFVNGAQIIVDQFLIPGESKWGVTSGLVLLLPHGYEGQGPEHSSARIERFLQLCAEDNIQVANCTTPAQYFHLLRRQMHGGQDRRGTQKPLIVFTPKSLLRHPKAVSTLQDLTNGTFRTVIDEPALAAQQVSRVLLCSGKVYYDLLAAREERQANHVTIIRTEQLYPFPQQEIQDALARYPLTAEVAWVQEEPRNMGPWRFMQESLQPVLDASKRTVRYIGRTESASPASGSKKRHDQEQAEIMEAAFSAAVIAPAPKRRRRK